MTEIVNKDALQKRDSRPIREHSRFGNSYMLAGTYRFGEYAPTKVIDCIPDDEHKTKSVHRVSSYTMPRPLMQDIMMKDDTFLIPYSALLPRNYELYNTVKNIGDDINAALVGTTVVGFTKKVSDLLNLVHSMPFASSSGTYVYSPTIQIELCLKYFVLLDMFCSSGCLLSSLGCPIVADGGKVDTVIDTFASYFKTVGTSDWNIRVKIGSDYYEIGRPAVNAGDASISFREFWNRIHDGFNWSVVSRTDNGNVLGDVASEWSDGDPDNFLVADSEAPVDLARPQSYQIACAHFYSNDKVDYIYSAELWRQNLRSLVLSVSSSIANATFTLNGVSSFYDECSAFFSGGMLDYLPTNLDETDYGNFAATFNAVFDWVRLIFGYNRSLRFVDYFTGARTRPLAPGDANVTVSGGKVNVVDTIQTKWYIRLWSQISRVGRKSSEQMKGLYPDVETTIDWHDPIYIGADSGSIYGDDTENTGTEQYNTDGKTPIAVTSRLKGGIQGKSFDFKLKDRSCIIMTISSFDITRFYSHGIDRHFFHVDRFDKFNPFCQFMGDQKVHLKELFADADYSAVFGYQGAYEEFKQNSDRAFGGFANGALPGMVFLADVGRNRWSIETQSPNYVRSYPCELDEFFTGLTGWSYGTYFHFMVLTENYIDSNRPMAYNPQIQ